MPTGIEYVDEVLNVSAGCQRVSEGCEHCWAELSACRLARNPRVSRITQKTYRSVITKTTDDNRLKLFPSAVSRGRWNGKIELMPERLGEPYKWRKPKWILVNSMSDLFHEDVPLGFVEKVWSTMFDCPQHTFLILTKRPQRLLNFANQMYSSGRKANHKNIRVGASIENQRRADERLPYLLSLAAMGWKTFVSCEPLLGPIDLTEWLEGGLICDSCGAEMNNSYKGEVHESLGDISDRFPNLCGHAVEKPFLDWVIVGDESGLNRRPCELDWVRDIRDQAIDAEIPFYLKQLHYPHGSKISLPTLDGRVWDQLP